MKVNISKQKAAYLAVKAYRGANPEAMLIEAVRAVADSTDSTVTSVRSAYYTHAHRNNDPIRHKHKKARKAKVIVIATAPEKKPANTSIDLNVMIATLQYAADKISALEERNQFLENHNRKILDGIKSLTVSTIV